MLVHRGSEAGHEEHIPCHYCSSLTRLGYDEHNYIAFTDNPDPQSVSRGQVWSIRESMMLPIAEFLKRFDRDLVYGDARSGKSRATTIETWIKLHRSKLTPRPCIILKGSGRKMSAYLLGTFNGGQFKELSLIVDMFCVQVDPSPEDRALNSSEQHVHSTPRWCSSKKQYVCVLPVEHRGRLPENHDENDVQGFVLDRWMEKHGTPEENGQVYGFSEKQINRINFILESRAGQWRKLEREQRRQAITQFREFVTKHLLEYGADDSPTGQPGGSLRSRFTPSSRTKRTFGGYFGNNLFTHTEHVPSDSASRHAHPMASPTRRSFADGRRSSRASIRH